MAIPVIGGATITYRPRALRSMLELPGGEVVNYHSAVAGRVVRSAKKFVGVAKPTPSRRESGKLKRSIRAVPKLGAANPRIDIEAGRNPRLDYAYPHHEGTLPHYIEGNPRLVFFWDDRGEWVSFTFVFHPGTKPNRFLTKAARVNGLQVTRALRS